LLLGLVALFLTGIFIRYGRGGEFEGQAPSFSSFKTLMSKPVFWILVVLFSLGISSTLGLYTMLPLYLVTEHGIERNWANSLVALSRVAGLVMTFVGGWLTDRFGSQRVLMIVFSLGGIMTLCIGIASRSWIVVPVFLQPMLAVSFFPAGLAALSLVSSEKERNIVISLTVPIAFLIGGGAVPTLIGFIGDISTFASGIVLVGGLIITGAFFTRFLKIED
jgi:NNP family nitrate/nitrite transporter-like MFS transporter